MPLPTTLRPIRMYIEDIDIFTLLRNLYMLGILRNPYHSFRAITLARCVSLRSCTDGCKKTHTFKIG